MLKFRPRQPKSSYEARYLLACETSIRPEVRGCCSFPLRSSVRSKRIEPSLLHRNLLHTLTVRNPEFLFRSDEVASTRILKFISRAEQVPGQQSPDTRSIFTFLRHVSTLRTRQRSIRDAPPKVQQRAPRMSPGANLAPCPSKRAAIDSRPSARFSSILLVAGCAYRSSDKRSA